MVITARADVSSAGSHAPSGFFVLISVILERWRPSRVFHQLPQATRRVSPLGKSISTIISLTRPISWRRLAYPCEARKGRRFHWFPRIRRLRSWSFLPRTVQAVRVVSHRAIVRPIVLISPKAACFLAVYGTVVNRLVEAEHCLGERKRQLASDTDVRG